MGFASPPFPKILPTKPRFCIEESYPPRVPWATRQAWIVLATTPPPEDCPRGSRRGSGFSDVLWFCLVRLAGEECCGSIQWSFWLLIKGRDNWWACLSLPRLSISYGTVGLGVFPVLKSLSGIITNQNEQKKVQQTSKKQWCIPIPPFYTMFFFLMSFGMSPSALC